MNEPERVPPDDVRQTEAQMSSARRTLAVAVAFGVTLAARDAAPGISALLDALLLAAALWALAPGILSGGPRFLHRDHWSRVMPVPLLLVAAAFVRDLWLLVRQ